MKKAVPGNNAELFSACYRQFYPVALKQVYQLEKDCRYAEDIVQDVFAAIWKMQQQNVRIEHFGHYLARTVRNAYYTYRRNLLRTPAGHLCAFEAAGLLPDKAAATDRRARSTTAFTVIESVISALPPKRRQVFRMSRLQQLNHHQIAAQLGIHPITVAQYIGKSLDALKPLKDQLHRQCA